MSDKLTSTSGEPPINVRPWGRYDILDSGKGFQVKRMTILPGKRFSYQRHARRSEYWTIVAGHAVVTLNGKEMKKTVGDTAVAPIGTKHRIANVGNVPLVFIEVQIGDYLEEDDIERFDDDFGRMT